jgi:hypothetical protein
MQNGFRQGMLFLRQPSTAVPDTLIQTFNVGTGLSDKQRRNPPKVGAIIVYRFQELTRDGVPRFVSVFKYLSSQNLTDI